MKGRYQKCGCGVDKGRSVVPSALVVRLNGIVMASLCTNRERS